MYYLILVSVIWGLSFSLIKGELTSIDPNLVAFLRLSISFIIFIPLLRLKNIQNRLFPHLLVIGGIQYGLMYTAYIYSFQYLKAYEIAILTIFTPIFVVLFHDIWKRKYFFTNWIKALLAIVGSAIILYQDNLTIGFWKGVLLLQVSNILFALGQVYYRMLFQKKGIMEHSGHYAILFAGGAFISGIFSLLLVDISEVSIGLNQFLVILYLGAVASGMCFFLWNYGITRINIGNAAIFNNLKIPLGVLFATIILGESINVMQLILGSFILIAAFYLKNLKGLFYRSLK